MRKPRKKERIIAKFMIYFFPGGWKGYNKGNNKFEDLVDYCIQQTGMK